MKSKIIFGLIILAIIFSAGCISNHEEPIFTIPDRTTVYSDDDTSTNYSSLNIPESVTNYQLVSFDNPIPNRNETVTMKYTLFGKEDSVVLNRMGFDMIDDGVDSYEGISYTAGGEGTHFILTAGDKNTLTGSITSDGKRIYIESVSKRNEAVNGKPFHIVYVLEEQKQPSVFTYLTYWLYVTLINPQPTSHIFIEYPESTSDDLEIVYPTKEDLNKYPVLYKAMTNGEDTINVYPSSSRIPMGGISEKDYYEIAGLYGNKYVVFDGKTFIIRQGPIS